MLFELDSSQLAVYSFYYSNIDTRRSIVVRYLYKVRLNSLSDVRKGASNNNNSSSSSSRRSVRSKVEGGV